MVRSRLPVRKRLKPNDCVLRLTENHPSLSKHLQSCDRDLCFFDIVRVYLIITAKSETVTKFEFEGNTAFSDEQLQAIAAKYINRSLSFAELLQIETEITKLYTEAGYLNSGAFLPAAQSFTPQGAVIKVEIVEGETEGIKVTGTDRLNENYVRSRLKSAASKPLNRFRLLEALQLLQLNPLIQNLSAELSAGSRPEKSVLEIKVNAVRNKLSQPVLNLIWDWIFLMQLSTEMPLTDAFLSGEDKDSLYVY